jgi:hypothetical protein
MKFTPEFECCAPDGKCPYGNVCVELTEAEDEWICEHLRVVRKPEPELIVCPEMRQAEEAYKKIHGVEI